MDNYASIVEKTVQDYDKDPANLVMILQDLQNELNYLPAPAIKILARKLDLPESLIYSVSTFYKAFSLEPLGRNRVDVCAGTACHIRGASMLISQISDQLKVKPGETTGDGELTLNAVRCVGACAMGPVAVINGEYYGNLTVSKLAKQIRKCCDAGETKTEQVFPCHKQQTKEHPPLGRINEPEEFKKLQTQLHQKCPVENPRILVCNGTGCKARGSFQVAEALSKELQQANFDLPVNLGLKRVGCHGLCEKGPLVIIYPDNICYTQVKSEDAVAIIQETVIGKKIVNRLLYREKKDDPGIKNITEIPFYKGQKKIALRNVGIIDPLDIKDYISQNGYNAFFKAQQEMDPREVIEAVKLSGLRGRGGGGFPTGVKWSTAAAIDSDIRYVICNGDEGDPGAFMDCSIMEGNPHAIIEGMMICAYAIGACRGFIYVREEYPRALQHLHLAIEQARSAGLLGNSIAGSDFSFDIKINRGAGAFVCGESTALMQSVEGKVGEPRAKYIRSAERGLYDQPTVLNNVETFANIPEIINNGGEWFSAVGTKDNTGTKVFSVVGKVKNTGLVEVPMGTSLRHIIFDICGGIKEDKPFKAVQTGGPSGGCLPESKLNLPVDFDTLTREGSMMGSGGMIVMDENTCMVDVARYFTSYLVEESCGKCSACRMSLANLHSILERICQGEGAKGDLEKLEKLLIVLENGSLCGLGKSAPNPVRSTLNHFREEYLAHISEKRCPAGVCRNLITYEITGNCSGCGLCAEACPQAAISGDKKEEHSIDQDLCNQCGICMTTCTFNAVVTRS